MDEGLDSFFFFSFFASKTYRVKIFLPKQTDPQGKKNKKTDLTYHQLDNYHQQNRPITKNAAD